MTNINTFKDLSNLIKKSTGKYYITFPLFDDMYTINYNTEDSVFDVNSFTDDITNINNKYIVNITDLDMYLAFSKITSTYQAPSITEIDLLRTDYRDIDRDTIEENSDGTITYFTKLQIGSNDTEYENDDNARYILGKWKTITTTEEDDLSDEDENSDTVSEEADTIENTTEILTVNHVEFSSSDAVGDLITTLITDGYGDTTSILDIINNREDYFSASEEVIEGDDDNYPLSDEEAQEIIDSLSLDDTDINTYDVIDNDNDSVMRISDDNIETYTVDVNSLLSEEAVTLSDIDIDNNIITMATTSSNNKNDTTTNKNNAKNAKKTTISAIKNDTKYNWIPKPFFECVYTYVGIQNCIRKKNKRYHLLCLGTSYMYDIIYYSKNKSYKIFPQGRKDVTLNKWFNKYDPIILCFNGTVANDFKRVEDNITVKNLEDITKDLYRSYSSTKIFTLTLYINADIEKVTLQGPEIKLLYDYMIKGNSKSLRYSGVGTKEGIFGWDGKNVYYSYKGKTAKHVLNKKGVTNAFLKILVKEGYVKKGGINQPKK